MGLFDIFTGDAMKDAARDQRSYLTQTQNTGLGQIATGYNAAQGVLPQGFRQARLDLGAGYAGAADAIQSGAAAGQGYLNNAAAALDPGSEAYKQLQAKYARATELGLGGLGAGGPEGTQAAWDAFKAGPGYNFNLDQGLSAINRRRNAGGMLDSGNADRDAQVFGAGLASQEYDKWMSNLLGFTQPELAATAGIAGTGQGIADINRQRAALATGEGTSLADIYAREGAGFGTLDTGLATALSNLATGRSAAQVDLSKAIMQPYTNTYQNEAMAEMAGSQNLWGLGMQAATLGASIANPAIGASFAALRGAPQQTSRAWGT